MLMDVRWYLTYPLSYRHVKELMAESGVPIDHATIQAITRAVYAFAERRLAWSRHASGNSRPCLSPGDQKHGCDQVAGCVCNPHFNPSATGASVGVSAGLTSQC
jgi:hypothetical protein